MQSRRGGRGRCEQVGVERGNMVEGVREQEWVERVGMGGGGH